MKTRIPILTLAIAAVVLAIQIIPGAAAALEFNRDRVFPDFWRVFTGHLTHFDWNHLRWDLGVWLALGFAIEHRSRARFALTAAASSLAIGAAVWLWQPQFQIYRGLSGIDCALAGLFAGSLLESRHRGAAIAGGITLFAALAKCGFEMATASTLFASGVGYAPVPLAHLIGLTIGAAPTVLQTLRQFPTLPVFARE
jgi:rhomboid family GlyGly-CTERM serine protease